MACGGPATSIAELKARGKASWLISDRQKIANAASKAIPIEIDVKGPSTGAVAMDVDDQNWMDKCLEQAESGSHIRISRMTRPETSAAWVRPDPPSLIAVKDEVMVKEEKQQQQPVRFSRAVVGPCFDEKVHARCCHEMKIETVERGVVTNTENCNMLSGLHIWLLIQTRGLVIDDKTKEHLRIQSEADTTKPHQHYKKTQMQTPASKKRSRAALKAEGASKAIATLPRIVLGKKSIKPVRPRAAVGIGGRRTMGTVSKSRMRTFVRETNKFKLTIRNTVHKCTTCPVPSLIPIRDRTIGAYSRYHFPASQQRNEDPQGTVSIMQSGEANITAARSDEEGLILMQQQAQQQLVQLRIAALMTNFGAANITASAGLGWMINLDKLSDFIFRCNNRMSITYDRTVFPGLHWRLKSPEGVVIGVFEGGFLNAVGLKTPRHLSYVEKVIIPLFFDAHREELELSKADGERVAEQIYNKVEKAAARMKDKGDADGIADAFSEFKIQDTKAEDTLVDAFKTMSVNGMGPYEAVLHASLQSSSRKVYDRVRKKGAKVLPLYLGPNPIYLPLFA